uniref:Uncharacterized protein n=1 Tax=Panagrolaimus sp. PS1159 TaxID=55785 RepID=A0AC35F3W5_9BILA
MYSEGESKVALASLNFVVGIGCISIILISLSIVPDCAGALSSQFLTYFVIQSTVHLGVLLVITLTVSFILAANDPEENKFDSADTFAGYTFLFGIIVVACLQFMISLHRYIRIIAPIFSLRIFSKLFVFASILGSFLIASNKLVNYVVAKKSLNYSLKLYRWQLSNAENQTFIQIIVISAASLFVVFYIGAITSVFVRNYLLADRRYFKKGILFKKLLSVTAFLFGDLFYAFLILLSYHRAQPKILISPEISTFTQFLYICEGYTQSFLLLLWPALSAIFYHKAMRSAIGVRMKLMINNEQMPAARRRRASSNKKISVISGPNPVYQYYDIQQPSTLLPHPRQSIILLPEV